MQQSLLDQEIPWLTYTVTTETSAADATYTATTAITTQAAALQPTGSADFAWSKQKVLYAGNFLTWVSDMVTQVPF